MSWSAANEEASEKDLKNTRTFKLDSGINIKAVRTGPNGYWSVHFDRGITPDMFKGEWITFPLVMRVVQQYADLKKAKILEIDQ